MSSKAPCKDCEKRHAGCHAKCPVYGEWNAKHIANRERIHEIKAQEQEVANYIFKTQERNRKRRNRKR